MERSPTSSSRYLRGSIFKGRPLFLIKPIVLTCGHLDEINVVVCHLLFLDGAAYEVLVEEPTLRHRIHVSPESYERIAANLLGGACVHFYRW